MDIGFDHVTVAVTDLQEAIAFFGHLGFVQSKAVVVSGPVMSAYMGIPGWEADHVTLVLDGAPQHQEVQLLRFHRPPVADDPGASRLDRVGINHICFRVADLDAMVARLRGHGVRTKNEVLDFHDRRLVFLEGPEGITVELAEWQSAPVGGSHGPAGSSANGAAGSPADGPADSPAGEPQARR